MLRLNYSCLNVVMMDKKQTIAIWTAIIGGGIAFFFLYGIAAELMR